MTTRPRFSSAFFYFHAGEENGIGGDLSRQLVSHGCHCHGCHPCPALPCPAPCCLSRVVSLRPPTTAPLTRSLKFKLPPPSSRHKGHVAGFIGPEDPDSRAWAWREDRLALAVSLRCWGQAAQHNMLLLHRKLVALWSMQTSELS